RRRILPVPEELVVLLLSNPALLEEELRELLRDLPGAVLDVGLDGLRERAGRSDSPGHRHVRRRQPCRRADPGHWSESRLPRALEALEWLTRKLDDAAFQFIREAKSGDQLLCCFYEFRYRPVADELKDAIDRGVDVRIIVDAKVNEFTDKDGFHKSFPREENLQMIADAKIPMAKVTLREARPKNIAHNKFMVRLTGPERTPKEVWTGSTNISLSGFSGQTNVGHWLRNTSVAGKSRDYWDLLRGDPGAKADDSPSDAKHANADFRADVEALFNVPTKIADIPKGVIPVFSPRTGSAVLDEYVTMVDTAAEFSCITLAFGINKAFKEQLKDNTANSHLIFMLLEKPDAPTKKNKPPSSRSTRRTTCTRL